MNNHNDTREARIALLIDADNVSADVIEQAVQRLLDMYRAVHVRRAYCTAESALANQKLFKRLGIRPMVNLAAGKNSTDIALAVDAMDLVLAERPDAVAIASSDSDFAPLVARLREKGCRVVGLGQLGKTGDEVKLVYDEFIELAHGAARARARKGVAGVALPTPNKPAASRSQPHVSDKAAEAVAVVTPAARRGARRGAVAAAPAVPADIAEIVEALPEVRDGVGLQAAAERLRQRGLLSRSGSSAKLFTKHAEWFELTPAQRPNRVRLRGPK